MANEITRQSDSLVLQDKEVMENIKYRAISYRTFIKAEFQTTTSIVKKINQYQIRPMDSIKK